MTTDHWQLPMLDWFQRSMLAIATAIMIFQLAIPPIVGIADNGDWGKIMYPAGFNHLPDAPGGALYLSTKLAFADYGGKAPHQQYFVSGRLIAKAARFIGRLFSRDGLFDLRVLGLLNASLLLFGFALIMAGTYPLPTIARRVLAALLVFIFTDVGYVAFCNSFYSQTASLIFLVMTAGFFAMTLSAPRNALLRFAGFAISATLFATSKPQEAPQVILLAALAAVMPKVLGMRKAVPVGAAVAMCMTAVTVLCAYRSSQEVHNNSIYNAFFQELLAASPDPKADLIAFSLNPELSRYAGTHAFLPDSPITSPEFEKEFFERVDYPDLFVFYLKRPARLWALLARRSQQAFTIRFPYGNYDRSTGFPPGQQSSSFALWSELKGTIVPGSIWTLVALFLASFTVVVVLWRKATLRCRLGLAGFVTLNLMAIGAFIICALSDGRLDIVRQLFAFNIMIDLVVVVSCQLSVVRAGVRDQGSVGVGQKG